MSSLKNKKLFLLDMDGTIYLDNDLFDGTLDFLDYIKEMRANGATERQIASALKIAYSSFNNCDSKLEKNN